MLSLWAIGLLGFLNQVEAQWTSPYQPQAQQTAAQFSQRGWGTSPAARMPWARMPNNIPNMNGGGVPGGMAGGVPGGMAGGMAGGVPGGMPGGVPGGMAGGVPGMAGGVPGGMPGGIPRGMSGGIPGGMPGSMNPNMMSNAMVQNRYPQQQYMGPTPTNSICVAPVSQPRLCMVNGENTHKYRLKDVIEFLGHPNVEKVPKCVPGVPRVNCADYYAAQYIWKRGYCYCKNFHKNLPSYQATSTNIRCVLNNCGACSQEFYVGKDRVVRFGARWGTGQPFQYTPPTQQPPTPNNAQFGQMNKFFPRPNQTPSWGQNPNAPQQNAWNFPRQMPTNVPNNVPGNMPGIVPNVPGGMPNNMGQGLMNNMRNPMTNMRPGVTPNMPGYPNFGGAGGYPANSHICIPPPTQPRLCTENGENQHKFRLKEVIRMLGDKNIEKIPQCVPGVQRINCADYHLAQYIWKRGYCYCKRYHSNMNAFKRYAPLRCVLNNCGACSQEFYIGKSRIVDCD